MRATLLFLLAVCTGALAFQPPAKLRAHHRVVGRGWTELPRGGRQGAVVDIASLPAKKADGDEKDSRIPFFARALQKFRKREDDGDAAVEVEEAPISNAAEIELDNNKNGAVAVDSEASKLRALAERTRLEAEKMDLSLTLEKIRRIEGRLQDDDERDKNIQEAQMLLSKLNGAVLSPTAPAPSQSSETSTEEEKKEERGEKSIVQEILDGEKPLLGEDKRQDAIDGFEKLPKQIKDMMAKTVGLKDGSNSTAVIDALMAENRLYEADGDNEKFSMVAKASDLDDLDVFVDLEFAEVTSFIKSLLPEVTRKSPVPEEYVDVLYDEVLGKDTFNPTERKPSAVPGGYLIKGENKVKSVEGRDDGDVLIERLDEKISKTSAAGKIQVCYILDPTPPSGEEIMNDEDEKPVLLVTNLDVTPTTNPLVKAGVTFLGMASLAVFALGSFAFNEEVLGQISSATSDAPDGSLDFLYDLSLPLAFSLLGTQLIHELGHLVVALKDGIEIGLPTVVPGLQFGLSGSITPIRSSPRSIKSLFDFAMAGPLLGIISSIVLLYNGLEITAFMDAAAQEQLPSIPAEILRSSALGGGIIDYLLGDGVLDSPDPAQMIKLHPYAIAGFAGLLINALSLLPIGNTDG